MENRILQDNERSWQIEAKQSDELDNDDYFKPEQNTTATISYHQ